MNSRTLLVSLRSTNKIPRVHFGKKVTLFYQLINSYFSKKIFQIFFEKKIFSKKNFKKKKSSPPKNNFSRDKFQKKFPKKKIFQKKFPDKMFSQNFLPNFWYWKGRFEKENEPWTESKSTSFRQPLYSIHDFEFQGRHVYSMFWEFK